MPPTTVDAIPFSTDDAPGRMPQQRAVRLWTTTLILLCIGTLFLLFRHIDRTLPYPYHADEGFISGPASKALVAGEPAHEDRGQGALQ